MLAAVAGFAGDAQVLAGSLAGGDRRAASKAMAALIADRSAVERALAKNSKAVDSSRWNSLKSELEALKVQVPPAAAAVAASAARGAPSAGVVPPPPEETSALGPPPRIAVTSRVFDDRGVRIRGYFEGEDLRSAGIYDGESLLTPVQLGVVRGRERVDFDFRLESVTASEAVRVSDSLGRTAEVRVAPDAAAETPHSGSHEKTIELGASPDGGGGSGPPAIVASKDKNTVEIPSRSPSRRHAHRGANLSPLAGVEVDILGVMRSASGANSYQVVGQISGEGVMRAGIYVDRRLVKPIPVAPGQFTQYTSFDIVFTMLGREATIRVYGAGNNYVESEVDLSTAGGEVFGANPPLLGVNPYGYGVNPYAPAYSPFGYGYGAPLNPYGSVNPYAPAPYGYGGPLGGGYGPPRVAPPPTTPGWPWR